MSHESSNTTTVLTGTVHGKHLELDKETGFADGQQVSVVIRPVPSKPDARRGQLNGFGGWADDPEGVDRFVEEMRRLRDIPSERETGL